MTCPACGLENPPAAQYCDCGHEFVLGSKPKESAPAQPQGTLCPKCNTLNLAVNAFCCKCGGPMQKTPVATVIVGVTVALVGIAVLVGVFDDRNSEKNTSRSSSSTSTPATPPPERPESKVSIKKFGWTKGGFDTVMLATFTLRNDNTYAVKDAKIKCELFGASGTKIDSVEETIYNSIPANGTKTFPEVNMGFMRSQTARASCEIQSVAKHY